MVSSRVRAYLANGPLVPVLVALAAHGVGVCGEFTADDTPSIMRHPVVTGEAPLAEVMRYNHHGKPVGQGQNLMRPLATLIFAAEYRLWGNNPFPYHVLSLLLYVLLVVVGQRCLRLFVPPAHATLGAALFASLAIHAEAVAAVANRNEILALLFTLLGLLAVASRREVLAVPAFVCALLSKESAFLFPALAVWYWLLVDGKVLGNRSRAAVLVALAGIGGAFLFYRLQLAPQLFERVLGGREALREADFGCVGIGV